MSIEVFKEKQFNTLNKKLNNLEKKIPDATTLVQINQYKTDKQEKIGEKNWRLHVLIM